MATIGRDVVVFFVLPSIVAGLILIKPDFSSIVNITLKFILLLAAFAFITHVISRVKDSLSSLRQPAKEPVSVKTETVNQEKLQKVRQNAQTEYNEQAAEHRENVILPRDEEKRRKKEKEFYRFDKNPWDGPGHILGGTQMLSESSLRAQPLQSANQQNCDATERGLSTPPGHSAQASLHNSDVKQSKKSLNIPDEPELNVPNSVSVALKSPRGRKHRRRFLTTDRVEVLLGYMESIGYSPKLHALYFSYPRQSISDDPMLTLAEVGIVRDILLNIEELD